MATNKRIFLLGNLLFISLVTLITATLEDFGSGSGGDELIPAGPDYVNKECNSVVVCKLEASKLSGPTGVAGPRGKTGEKGEKGDMGPSGLNGTNGDSGLKGNQGNPGLPGIQGSKGESGLKGEKGDQGPSGLNGTNGDSGLKGNQGNPGLPGIQGPKGEPGSRGEKGDQGPPGRMKVCPSCSKGDSSVAVDINMNVYGTEELPGDFLCAKETVTVPKNREPWIVGSERNPISTYCKETDNSTCVKGSKSGSFKFGNESKPFWLSEMPIGLNQPISLKLSQLQWLQERSSSVYQTIRYYCKNSRPYNPDNLEKSILLSTWNNIIIGPEPSLNTPLKYSVLKDQCSGGSKGDSLYTEIEVKTNIVQRLPVVDYLIRDVENAGQEVSIETVEICFL